MLLYSTKDNIFWTRNHMGLFNNKSSKMYFLQVLQVGEALLHTLHPSISVIVSGLDCLTF